MKKGEFCLSPEHFSQKYGNGSTLSTYEINYQRSSSHILNKHKCYLDDKGLSVPTSFTSNKFATITTSNYPYENDSSYKALLLDKIRNEYRKSSIVDKDINARTCRILMNASSNTTITNNNNNNTYSNSNIKLHSITPISGNSPIKFQNLNNRTTSLTNTNNELNDIKKELKRNEKEKKKMGSTITKLSTKNEELRVGNEKLHGIVYGKFKHK